MQGAAMVGFRSLFGPPFSGFGNHAIHVGYIDGLPPEEGLGDESDWPPSLVVYATDASQHSFSL